MSAFFVNRPDGSGLQSRERMLRNMTDPKASPDGLVVTQEDEALFSDLLQAGEFWPGHVNANKMRQVIAHHRTRPTPDPVAAEATDEREKVERLAEEVTSAANIVSHDGYYELDIEAVTRTLDNYLRTPSPTWREAVEALESVRAENAGNFNRNGAEWKAYDQAVLDCCATLEALANQPNDTEGQK